MVEGESAKSEGFRALPERMTPACLGYAARVIELRDFVNLYFSVVKSFEHLVSLVPDGAIEKLRSAPDGKYLPVEYNYSVHRQFVNEVVLARVVESFDHYLLQILRDIFIAQPNMLKGEQTIDVATVIDLKDYNAIIERIVERRLHDLAYKPLSELNAFIESRTGISLFGDEDAKAAAILATEVRNLIAHNDCKTNLHFQKRTVGISVDCVVEPSGKLRLEDVWLRKLCYRLDGIVFDFDERAAKKFGLGSASERNFVLDR